MAQGGGAPDGVMAVWLSLRPVRVVAQPSLLLRLQRFLEELNEAAAVHEAAEEVLIAATQV